jgi:hypothetical protein
MPLKVTKEMSSHLIKYVRKVDVSFNRELLILVMVLHLFYFSSQTPTLTPCEQPQI